MITFLYSVAGICPHKTHAAFHICSSNPSFALLFTAMILPPIYFLFIPFPFQQNQSLVILILRIVLHPDRLWFLFYFFILVFVFFMDTHSLGRLSWVYL